MGYFISIKFIYLSFAFSHNYQNDSTCDTNDLECFDFSIADYLSPEVAFLIVNALYFKASWSVLFDEGVPQTFTTIDGQKTIVSMMTRTSLHNYGARFEMDLVPHTRFTAVAIPYEVIFLILIWCSKK